VGSANGLADLGLQKFLQKPCNAFQDKFKSIDTIIINGNKSLHLSDLGFKCTAYKKL
jgi:hypothetical protein